MSDQTPQAPPPGIDIGGPWGNLLNDPSIMELAEKLQQDPSFQQMQEALQQAFVGMPKPGEPSAAGEEGAQAQAAAPAAAPAEGPAAAAAAGAGGFPGMAGFPGMPGIPGMDPANAESAMGAMKELYSNPAFLQMAQKIGESMLQQNPVMKAMMDPSRREVMQAKFEELKQDPEIAPIMAELESGDPQAMMKYWNNPEILKKFSEAVQDVMGDVEGEALDAAAEDAPPSMQLFAGEGNIEGLKELLAKGVEIDNVDEEGRTGLQFACGYGEIECVKWFLENNAKLDIADNNKNTALHYAAGYGQVEVVALLIEKGADISSKNEDGNTSREVAELNEKDDIVKLLEGAMKDLKI